MRRGGHRGLAPVAGHLDAFRLDEPERQSKHQEQKGKSHQPAQGAPLDQAHPRNTLPSPLDRISKSLVRPDG